MIRKVTEEEKAEVRQKARLIGGHLVRLGRYYRAALLTPNRDETNVDEKFGEALGEFVIALGESGLLD